MHSRIPDRSSWKLAALVIGAALLAACETKKEPAPVVKAEHAEGTIATTPDQPGRQLYQCAMHPNVVSDKPGKCPICGMELQPVTRIAARGIPGRAPVQLSTLQTQLINMRTAPVTRSVMAQTIRTVGRIAVDEEKTATLNSRVMGWVEKLHVNKTGETVARDQPLLEIYSPALYSAQQDFLIVSRRHKDGDPEDALLASARKRLELWGISGAQIEKLAQSGQPTSTLTLTAPLGGTVVEKPVVDAQMVQPGMPLFRIADLSTVWVMADLYESELPFVQTGQEAAVTIPSYPGRTWKGQVDFIYPYLQGKTRTNQARVVLPNPDGLLKPDMYVNVELGRDLGEQLSVPNSAIFDTGKRQYLFVEQQPGVFVPVIVELGPRVGDRRIVRNGVGVDDRVVVDGNFLLDSESQLKAAASGSTGESAPAETTATPNYPLPAETAAVADDLLTAYGRWHDALFKDGFTPAADSLAVMQKAVTSLREPQYAPTTHHSDFVAKLDSLDKALAAPPPADLAAARIRFGDVSAALIELVTTFPPPVSKPLSVIHCPMWSESPADWLQTGSVTQNPFYGSSMPTCGNIVGTIGKDERHD